MLMKSILTALALSSAPLWLSGVFPGAGERSVAVRCCEIPACCKTVAIAPGACCKIVSASTALASNAVVLSADVVKTDGDAPKAFVVYAGTPGLTSVSAIAGQTIALLGDDDNQGAWLGVQIGQVPQALSVQLDLDGRGLVITNVVEDSPAERAGIEPHDVVVSLDGQTVDGNAAELGRMIGELEPDTEITLSILRNGKPKTLEVTLGSRPGQYVWRFDGGAGELELIEEDSFRSTGRIILQGPSGKWLVKDLREIDEIVDLSDDIKAIIPQIGTMSKFVRVGDGGHSFQIHLSHNGENISISREDDGNITVTRRDEDGEETTTVYDSEDALRDGDEEAFDVFDGRQANGTFAFRFETGDFNFDGLTDLHVKLKGMAFDTEALHGRIQAHIAQVQESATDALEGLDGLHFEFDGTDFNWPDMLKNHGVWRQQFDAGHHAFAFQFGKPRHTFEVNDDGSIEVRIRKGDSELLRKFESADDLADRNPRLFEKYESLMEADQEE